MKSKTEVPDTFDHHILLYAKNWYKKSGNIIEDLRILLAKYSGTDVDFITPNLVRECLVSCFNDYAPCYNKDRALLEMLKWGWTGQISSRTPEEVMLGSLSIAEGKYVDPTKLMPVLIKDRNPILPDEALE